MGKEYYSKGELNMKVDHHSDTRKTITVIELASSAILFEADINNFSLLPFEDYCWDFVYEVLLDGSFVVSMDKLDRDILIRLEDVPRHFIDEKYDKIFSSAQDYAKSYEMTLEEYISLDADGTLREIVELARRRQQFEVCDRTTTVNGSYLELRFDDKDNILITLKSETVYYMIITNEREFSIEYFEDTLEYIDVEIVGETLIINERDNVFLINMITGRLLKRLQEISQIDVTQLDLKENITHRKLMFLVAESRRKLLSLNYNGVGGVN